MIFLNNKIVERWQKPKKKIWKKILENLAYKYVSKNSQD